MNDLLSGRILMGDSLGVHILFALLGVGLPVVIALLEYWAIRRRNEELRRMAQLWSYIAGVLVVTGALSGTVVALQMFLIWPGILQFGGQAIALAFSWEGYAFIVEAVFLGYYIKTWKTREGWSHWVLMLPVIIGATVSAILITAVDAWMNNPTGITVTGGRITSADPIAAIFNQTTYLQATHSILAYYMTAALLVAAVFAVRLLRGQTKAAVADALKLAVGRLTVFALVLLGAIAIYGDLSAKYLANVEPTKLAAIELLGSTTSNAPLVLGGVPGPDGSAQGGLQIPGLLSWLVGGSTNTTVQGLSSVPESQWPPLVVHTLFDIKLLAIGLLGLVVLTFGFLYVTKRRAAAFSAPMLRLLVATPIVSAAIIELGWMVTEIGRQPYAVYGHVLTQEAFTTSPGVYALAWLFPVAYVVLAVVTIGGVWRVATNFSASAAKGGAK